MKSGGLEPPLNSIHHKVGRAWTLKCFDGKYIPFESMSMKLIVEDGYFFSKLQRLVVATRGNVKR